LSHNALALTGEEISHCFAKGSRPLYS